MQEIEIDLIYLKFFHPLPCPLFFHLNFFPYQGPFLSHSLLLYLYISLTLSYFQCFFIQGLQTKICEQGLQQSNGQSKTYWGRGNKALRYSERRRDRVRPIGKRDGWVGVKGTSPVERGCQFSQRHSSRNSVHVFQLKNNVYLYTVLQITY